MLQSGKIITVGVGTKGGPIPLKETEFRGYHKDDQTVEITKRDATIPNCNYKRFKDGYI
jgi:hypothetical protein